MRKNKGLMFTIRMIAGVSVILISILTILYGLALFPLDFLSIRFMNYLVGGAIGIAIGVCMIPGLSNVVKQGVILLTAMLLSAHCFLFKMNLFLKLISTVFIMGLGIGLVFWLSLKSTVGNTVKICKKCSGVLPEKLEQFAAENGYHVKYGCIGKCIGSCNQKQYIGLQNGKVILADSEQGFFERLKNKE